MATGHTSNTGVDDDERQALRAEGLDPDNPGVIAAIDLVRWELSLMPLSQRDSMATKPSFAQNHPNCPT